MGFVGNYAPCGLSPQTDGMPVIHKNDSTTTMVESMVESMSESMSELEQKRMSIINNYLKEHESINSSIAGQLLSIEVRTARRLLNKAVEAGLLIRSGNTKNRIYMRNV